MTRVDCDHKHSRDVSSPRSPHTHHLQHGQEVACESPSGCRRQSVLRIAHQNPRASTKGHVATTARHCLLLTAHLGLVRTASLFPDRDQTRRQPNPCRHDTTNTLNTRPASSVLWPFLSPAHLRHAQVRCCSASSQANMLPLCSLGGSVDIPPSTACSSDVQSGWLLGPSHSHPPLQSPCFHSPPCLRPRNPRVSIVQ
jgi:hypothetical protein